MKILVIGGSQGTGAAAVAAALERGHEVTVLARSPHRLALEHPKLRKLAGSFHDAAALGSAVAGQDAVIQAAFVSGLKVFKTDPTYVSRGTSVAIEAMKQHGVKRLVVLSALGVGDSRPLFSWPLRKLLIDWLLKGPYDDHEREEPIVRASGLEWVIARPSKLTNGAARKRYVKTAAIEPVPSSISRADTGDFLVAACEDDAWVGKAVQLGG